ncbi:MAG: T9SS type A sorting domain-containing protein, partial [Bacteroidales bacterium]|nr:T9SS type A sorting domain-containing protein [Bacteroidales bacterium]
VFNLMGQKVYVYNAGIVGSGVHQLTIDGSNLQSGVFFYTVKADENSVTRKMIVN